MHNYRKKMPYLTTTRIGKALMLCIVAVFALSGLTDAANQRRGPKVTSITVAPAGKSIGDEFGGGKIAYILQAGESIGYIDAEGNAQTQAYDANVQHGLIAAAEDQSTGIIWAVSGKQTTAVGGTGTGTAIGTGAANTLKIIAQNGDGATYAAGLARAYRGGEYDDWYLPSKEELNKLYLNLYLHEPSLGGFVASNYWSSSEYSATNAWSQAFYSGRQYYNLKNSYIRVRAVRAF